MELEQLNLSSSPMSSPELQLPPGFRFHPTDEELVVHYLSQKLASHSFKPVPIVTEIDLYKFDPWELPQKASFGEREWYFFSPRDRKYPNGVRPNRAAASGYWKATGTDKMIHSSSDGRKIGVKKALVFYKGRAPKGVKSNWIMHEYRLVDHSNKPILARKRGSLRLDDWVLCRIYKKKVKALGKTATTKPETRRMTSGLPIDEDIIVASLPVDRDQEQQVGNDQPFLHALVSGGSSLQAQENSALSILSSMEMGRSHKQQPMPEDEAAMFSSGTRSVAQTGGLWPFGSGANLLLEQQQQDQAAQFSVQLEQQAYDHRRQQHVAFVNQQQVVEDFFSRTSTPTAQATPMLFPLLFNAANSSSSSNNNNTSFSPASAYR